MIRNSVRIFGLVILRKQVECLERSHNKDSDCSDDNNKVFFHLEYNYFLLQTVRSICPSYTVISCLASCVDYITTQRYAQHSDIVYTTDSI